MYLQVSMFGAYGCVGENHPLKTSSGQRGQTSALPPTANSKPVAGCGLQSGTVKGRLKSGFSKLKRGEVLAGQEMKVIDYLAIVSSGSRLSQTSSYSMSFAMCFC